MSEQAIEHGMDVPPGTEMPEGFELGDGVRRDSRCVENWEGCKSGQYNPYCCRFPKSCSANSVRNRVYKEGILEPPTTRVITEGAGLLLGRASGSVSIELSEAAREEIQHLRMYYIDMEQVHSLHRWASANPGVDPTPELLVKWRMDGMVEWTEDHPNLSALLEASSIHTASSQLP